jgi:hypothetical protein
MKAPGPVVVWLALPADARACAYARGWAVVSGLVAMLVVLLTL